MMNVTKMAPPWRSLLVAAAAGILLSVFGMAGQAQAAGAPAVQQGDPADSGRDDIEVRGRIEAMPSTGLIGQWTVGGSTYNTVAETQFDQEEGDFAVGGCVKLHLKQDRTTVREMDSEPAGDCTGGNNDDDDDRNGREFYGIVQTMPMTGFVGSWTINGGVYTVTVQTEVKQKYGPIEIGSCVEVQLTQNGSAVRELQSKRSANCSDDDDDSDPSIGRGELYARLVSFPPDLIGQWVIGVITMTADANTEFQQRNGVFTVGEYVKAEFRIQADGTFLAREIKTINTRGDDDDDDHGRGDDDDVRHDGKAFGLIDSVPAGNLGIWQIGGISYTVTISTELDSERGALIAGQNVKVEYWTDDQGNRTAIEIKAMPQGAGSSQELLKLVGYVQAMPNDGFVGNWTVGGVDFVADAGSRFEEEHGFLAPDVFVEIKYVLRDGIRVIVKLETHVLPGGGDDDHYGRVDRMDDSLAASATSETAATWTVGGRTYIVTDATDVSRNVATGSTVIVNSYAAADGAQVATRIDSVTLNNMLYLPAASK